MRTPHHDFPAARILEGLLETQIPGSGEATRRLRQQLLSWIGDISARTVLLQGPIGIGKSSLARLLAFGKRVAPLREEEAQTRAGNLRFEAPGLIDVRAMPWYVELALTGLVETLADTQLFGAAKGAYTSGMERPGVFEEASTGRRGSPIDGSGITGGVVFLDEVGDLSETLQAKLLPVLSGGIFYRVGGEGNSKYALSFNGIVISASWRMPLHDRVRPDLLSRLSASVIRLPSLTERKEDIFSLISSIELKVQERLKATVKRMMLDPAMDRKFYEELIGERRELRPEDRKRLVQVDWSKRGELRGLNQTIEHLLIGGHSFEDSLAVTISSVEQSDAASQYVGYLLKWLSERTDNGRGLAAHLGEFERLMRAEFREQLKAYPDLLRNLADKLGIEEHSFRTQLRQLGRSRSNKSV